MKFHDHVLALLAERERSHLLRRPRVVSGAQGPEIVVDGRKAICLCSNNYLGLADHPALSEAMISAARDLGVGACASRHITGSMDLHCAAEERLARFVGLERALLFPTGYLANQAAIQGLANQDTLVFSDSLNHASLIDGCRLSRAEVIVYPHLDLERLEQLLQRRRGEARVALIASESLYSMDGDSPPLRALRHLADRFECGLLVDEAHAIGVLGPSGRGLCAREQVQPDVLMGTLGKAFGVSGAFLAGSRELIQLVENRARAYVFATAPSPALAATAIAATELVEAADDRRAALHANARRLREGLIALDYELVPSDTQILPVLIGEAAATMELSALLLELGVFVHGVRPPTVPAGTSRLRVTPMATHQSQHLDAALTAFARARPRVNLT